MVRVLMQEPVASGAGADARAGGQVYRCMSGRSLTASSTVGAAWVAAGINGIGAADGVEG